VCLPRFPGVPTLIGAGRIHAVTKGEGRSPPSVPDVPISEAPGEVDADVHHGAADSLHTATNSDVTAE
jgi:hypothetical protein